MNENRPPKEALNTKAAGIVAGAVMLSRVLGLARELIFAGLFGAGRGMDAFLTAFRAPNLLRDLFAEGALSTAFVTVFSQRIATEGEGSAWKLASKMATLTTVFMSLLTLLGVMFAAPFIGFLAPGFPAEKAALTIQLTQIMYPFILLVSLAALVMGMLNATNRFTIPALASSFFNIGSIAGGVAFGWLLDPHFGERALIGLAMGTLLGGGLQLGVQLPGLHKAGCRFVLDFHWRDPGVRRVLILMLPAVIAASAVQINVMVNSIFASYLGDGPVSWLSYAFRLMQLPLGVFGVAVATVTLPVISKAAALGEMGRFRSTLAKGMRLAVFLTLPSAVGLIVLAEPIIALIYQRGKFLDADSLHTAEALQFYAIGLVGYSCIKVLSPAFYAINHKWTPMMVSFLSIGMNLALNVLFIFHFRMGHKGLALSTALSATVNFTLLYILMTRISGSLDATVMISTFGRCLLAAVPIGLVGWLSHPWIASLAHASAFLRAGALLTVICTAAVLFLLSSWALKIEGFQEFLAIVGRKLGAGRRLKNSPSKD
jgi:putative peptidoglycan lipid II flippase